MTDAVREMKTAFERVRRELFQHWERGSEWRIEKTEGVDERFLGQCVRKERVIRVHPSACDDRDDLEAIIVHEICRALGPCRHDDGWKACMREAAAKAAAAGRSRLACFIRRDLCEIEHTPEVREVIARLVKERPTVSFQEVVDELCKIFGLPKAVMEDQRHKFLEAYEEAKREGSPGTA